MEKMVCKSCGATDFHQEDGYQVCDYCGTKYYPTKEVYNSARINRNENTHYSDTSISISEDVERLLEKCRADPKNAERYTKRVLEIDPHNKEIYKVLEDIKKKNESGGCYIATAVYGSYDCPEVWTLRRFRDDTLTKTWYGRAFVRTYYAISPTLVKWFGENIWFKNLWRPTLDRMVLKLNTSGVANTPYSDRQR